MGMTNPVIYSIRGRLFSAVAFALSLTAVTTARVQAEAVTLVETGSTLLYPLFNIWVANYTKTHPGVDITTKVRLRGIDAPELRARCADERRKAEAARDALAAMLDKTRPSVRSCFKSRPNPAPTASRTVISCRRPKALTSSRLLTFAHTMRSTKTTTPRAMLSVGSRVLALLKGVFHNGYSLIPRPRFVAG